MNTLRAAVVVLSGAMVGVQAADAAIVVGWDFNLATTSNLFTVPITNSHGNANNAVGVRLITSNSNLNAGDIPQSFTGTTINVDPVATNAPSGNAPAFPTGVLAGQGYSFRFGTAPGNSGRGFSFPFDNSGTLNTTIQFALRFSGTTAPSLVEVFSSTDGGTNYSATPAMSVNSLLAPQSWQSVPGASSQRDANFRYYEATIPGLDNAGTAALKFVFTWGAGTGSTGSARIDNLAVTPTPGTLALMGVGGLVVGRRRRAMA